MFDNNFQHSLSGKMDTGPDVSDMPATLSGWVPSAMGPKVTK
jgi:hypothetical protein